MVKILRDIKAPVKKTITLQENKREKGHLRLIKKSKIPTEDLHNRREQKSDNQLPTTNYQASATKFSNLFQLATIGIVIIFTINIFTVLVKTNYLKEDISYSASQAYQDLVDGGENILQTNFNNAFKSFNSAQNNFEQIGENLWFLKDKTIISGSSETFLSDASSFMRIGENLTQAGKNFSSGFEAMQKVSELFLKEKLESQLPSFERLEQRDSITDALNLALNHFKQAETRINNVNQLLSQIDTSKYPENYRIQISTAILKLKKLSNYLDTLNSSFPVILKLLGDKHPHTYLVLFHNSNEIRPVLGFIGSFAVVDVDEGYIEQIKINDVYQLDGQFYENIEGLPDELSHLSGRLKMRDSNYSPDASISLKNAAWFYQKQGGKSVDTVISIDQNVLGQILAITGPLDVPGLKAPINAENYDFIISYIVENKLFGESNPKAVLNEIFAALNTKLKDKRYHTKSAELLLDLIKDQKILAYSKDEEIQKTLKKLNISGQLTNWSKKTDGLQIIRTSIGGNKSDKYIKTNIKHSTYIASNGDLTNQVEIELQHTWHDGILKEWNRILAQFEYDDFSETIKDIEGRGNNRSGIRLYIPKNSELIDLIGFASDSISKKYDKDLDRDYFYLELEVAPQHTRSLTLSYRLPFKLNVEDLDTYKFIYEPQIGAKNVKLNKIIRGDVGIENYKNFPEQDISPARTIEYNVNGTKHQYFSGVWGE